MIEAYASLKEKEPLVPFTYEPKPVGPFDVEVEITHCGICHSDLHLIQNDWNHSSFPLVPGHEIIGTIQAKGKNVHGFELGDRVGIGWQGSSCGSCEWCHQGEENLCSLEKDTCVGNHGGFAKGIIADSRFAFAIPERLSSQTAAPLLCGGATVFSPLVQHKIDATMKIGVVGIGGLGHLALQFANAFGYEVTAISSSKSKEVEAKQLGAHHFVSQGEDNSLDMILCTSSAQMEYEKYLSLLRPKGILCLLGIPAGGRVDVGVGNLVAGRKTICGSNIASPPIIRKMLAFAAKHNIEAKTELFPLSDVNVALDKMAKNQIHYRAVLEM